MQSLLVQRAARAAAGQAAAEAVASPLRSAAPQAAASSVSTASCCWVSETPAEDTCHVGGTVGMMVARQHETLSQLLEGMTELRGELHALKAGMSELQSLAGGAAPAAEVPAAAAAPDRHRSEPVLLEELERQRRDDRRRRLRRRLWGGRLR